MSQAPLFPDTDDFSVLAVRDQLGVTDGQLLIDGGWGPATGGDWLEQIHPSTQELVARVPKAHVTDVDRAVRAARLAFDEGPGRA